TSEYLHFCINCLEIMVPICELQALFRAQAKETTKIKAIVKQLEHAFLQLPVEINQDIPADDNVHFPKHLVSGQIMVGKDDVAFEPLIHDHAFVLAGLIIRQG